MASLGELVVKISATADRFKQDMSVAGGAIAKFNVIVAAAQQVLGPMMDRLSSIDDTGDFAAQIGASAEELTGLRYAAEQAGSSADAVDAGLQKMVTTIGKARAGSKEAVKAFESLGLNIDSLAKESTGEQFKIIADRIAEIPNVSDQAAAAVAIFGKNGADLLNVLREGADGISQFVEEGKKVGAVLSDEAAAKAGEASDAMKKLQAAFEGTKNSILVEVAPALTTLAGLLTTAIEKYNDLRDAAKRTGQNVFGKTFDDERAQAEQIFQDRKNKIAADAAAFQQAKQEEVAAAAKVAAKSAEKQAKEQAKKQVKMQKQVADEAERAREQVLARGTALAESLRTPQEQYNATIADTLKLLQVGAIDFGTFERAAKQASDTLQKTDDAKKKALGISATPGVAALQAGTTAGFSATQSGFRGQDAVSRMAGEQVRTQKEQLASQQRTEQALREGQKAIKEALDKNTKAVEKMAKNTAGSDAMPPPSL